MKAKLHLVFSISIFFMVFCGWSQDNYWKPVIEKGSSKISSTKENPSKYSLETQIFQKTLNNKDKSLLYFPDASGKIIGFKVKETPIFHPLLTAKYPQIKSYTGWSQDKSYKIRFSSSHRGIQGMLISTTNKAKATFIEKDKNSDNYIAYSGTSRAGGKDGFICDTPILQAASPAAIHGSIIDDQTLRVYRLAISTTGEYTQYHGGTKADALAAINATLTRVNEVFETDLSIRLELIANNDLVIYTDPNTDPYTNNLNGQAQNTLSTIIGEANYDVGQVFQSGSNNGNAGFIGSVCLDNRKGSAFSSGVNPEGDLFDIDYVSHELGHQFGANHTWSFESENTGVQAEPASGTTIMGYAGIVEGNDVEPIGEDYFHYNSIIQISNYLMTSDCAQTISLSNSPPVVNPLLDYTIPKGTAFVLEGEATDVDFGNVLTYAWEQIDDGVVVTSTFGPENANGANFRSLKPTTNPQRYFPKLSSIVSGNLTQTNPAESSAWETVSTIEREFNFALTVRDNAIGGGQVASQLTKINTVNNAGPFVVTSQAVNEVYTAGSLQEITWDVANTNSAPVNTEFVTIYLSLDGGVSFPLVIADMVPNTGSAEVQIPGQATTTARIMIKAIDNVFLAVNTADFTIQETDVVLNFQTLAFEVCKPDDITIPFTFETYGGFNEEVTFSAGNMPAGLTASFSPTSASANGTAIAVTFSNTASIAVGSYLIDIIGESTGLTVETPITIHIYDTNFTEVALLSPLDLETNTVVNPQLQWDANENDTQYGIEIATDDAFTTIVETATVNFNFYQTTNLQSETNYFWRVKPINSCGEGNFGTPFNFTTSPITCRTIEGNGLPIEISNINPSTVITTISVIDDLPIADLDVNLDITHSFLEDLIVTLTSPEGTSVTLISKHCGNRNNISAVFDDDGNTINCSINSPSINGTVKPLGSLSSFNGESPIGDWILRVEDTANGDGGSIDSFSLEICVEGILRPDDDGDGVFDDGDDLCLGTPKGIQVDVTGCPINRFSADNFTIKVQSESCRNNDDGAIEINALDDAITYSATLIGPTATLNSDFTDLSLFENLVGGNYELCITGTNGSVTYQESCFSLVVGEPEILMVSTAIMANSLEALITLQGGSLYNVELNGVVTQTESDSITLRLKPGSNSLNVFTNLPCQGNYEETLFLITSPIVYPNPVQDRLTVSFNREVQDIVIQLFDDSGRLVYEELEMIRRTDLELDFDRFPVGVYFLKITGQGFEENFKVFKK